MPDREPDAPAWPRRARRNRGRRARQTQMLAQRGQEAGAVRVKRALRQLPDEFRAAVYLADVEGYAYRKIAGITGTSAGTVAPRLHRGRSQER